MNKVTVVVNRDPHTRLLRDPTGYELRRLRSLHRRADFLAKVITEQGDARTDIRFLEAELSALDWALKLLDPKDLGRWH